jgi:hypothetical protein
MWFRLWRCTVVATEHFIQCSTAGAVVGVAVVAAVASYEHAYALVRAHGEAGWTARLVPLTAYGRSAPGTRPACRIGLNTLAGWDTAGRYEKGLAKAYPHHTLQGTVGLWSKLPLSDTQPIDIMDVGALADTMPAGKKMASDRALRTMVATDHGPPIVYVAHPGPSG